jgi:catechol 2,3-dioxygenase-like lactoylglutathione lyase family enzyme
MPGVDERPPVWIGHVAHTVTDVARAADFWVTLGMREVWRDDEIAIMELRGGTHLLLFPGPAAEQIDFDVMVDDLDAMHTRLHANGIDVSEIRTDRHHRAFTAREPDGATVTVNDSHVEGPV